ncbi:helicase-related protein [Dactylosporangium sp. CA-092794]|uniref:helicase-related protein n=1 Tax=Dactylosporangium sp. CA-092794 TaxID=3239929 RepID=UPI003D8CE3FA
MRLEDLVPGASVIGVVPGGPVEVIAVAPMGPDTVRLVYRTEAGALGEQILMRVSEPSLQLVETQRTPFDAAAEDFKLAAEAMRIRAAAQSDLMLAVTTSDLEPLPHQIEAVYGHLLDKVPLRFLLADDPGAGKTIMAGLYLKELMLRGDLSRCLIVAPGGLVGQWQDELSEKFGLRFAVLTADTAAAVPPGQSVFEEYPRLIARMDHLSRNETLVEQISHSSFDVVVVDEAHRMSAHYFGKKLQSTKRYKLGQMLGRSAQNLLLMTATPHAGKEEDFQLFLALLDPDRFEGKYRKNEHVLDADGLMLRRVKEDLLTFAGKPLFTQRVAYTVPYELSDLEAELYEAVTEYVRQEWDRVDQLRSAGEIVRGNRVGFALTVLQRRLASSPEAILRSLQRRQERLERRLNELLTKPAAKDKERLPDVELADLLDDDLTDSMEETEEQVVDAATAARSADELRFEISVLQGLVALAAKVRASGADRKWAELKVLLQRHATHKLIIFSEHRDTLAYLVEGIAGVLNKDAVVAIHGAMSREARRAVQDRFTSDPGCLVLVATDAAGEGLNLQRAHLMVNYDLPWNPNRIEQRFGRIHRIGQREMCHLWNLVAVNTREGAVFERLLAKIEEQNAALGGKVFDVLGEAFEGEPLHELLLAAIRRGQDPKVRAHLDRIIDERVGDRAVKLVQERALHQDLRSVSDVDTARRDMEEARLLRLQPHYIEGFFRDAFGRAGGRIREREASRWEIPSVPQQVRELRTPTAPINLRYERVCFDRSAIRVDGGLPAQLLAPGHPLLDGLVQFTVEQYGQALERGTVMVDRLDPSEDPRLLVALDEEIIDGMERAVAKRFQYVELWHDGRARPSAAPFLDYDAPTAYELELTVDLLTAPWLSGARRTAEHWAASEDLPQWYATISERRRDQVRRTTGLVRERLEQEIQYWRDEAARLANIVRHGGKPAMQPTTAEQRAQDLRRRLSRRMAELDQEAHTQVRPPAVAAVALVVPQGLIDRRAGRRADLAAEYLEDLAAVERRAVQAVVQAERRLGRVPQVMAHDNPGYDVRSADPDGHLVHIEVKGRAAGHDSFFVTNREIRAGQNADNYRLALVEVDEQDPAADRVRYVRDPFADVRVSALVNGVQFKWPQMWARGTEPS